VCFVVASSAQTVRLRTALLLGVLVPFLLSDLLLATATMQSHERTRTGITTKTIEIWSQRNANAEVLLTVPAGTRLTITGRARKGFYPVTIAGVSGWTLTGSVAIEVGNRPRRGARERPRRALRGFATEALNLRTGPNASRPVQRVVPAGEELELTGVERDGFLAVRHDGEAGWVAEEFVSGQEPSPDTVFPVLRGDPRHMTPDEIIPFIYAAADYYGQPREDMLRVARCESGLVPMATNVEGGSYGIFQFKTGTWLSTPYAEYDIFDPRASAYAAAWMWSVGRRNEWVCQ
jgi:hypothetical protein